MTALSFANPYKPGAGHMPPHLAGREAEHREFLRLLEQTTILENLVLTGLRGVGKTVLLETFRPLAISRGWAWAGTDLSESASISENNLAIRLIADLAVVTSSLTVTETAKRHLGFAPSASVTTHKSVDYNFLASIYEGTPGLPVDKLKAVLEFAHDALEKAGNGRVVFAYDEAQNLADNAVKNEFPLSLLLEVFQSIQRKGIPFLLVLTGLPTLFPKLVEARTYAERMFRVVTLTRLSPEESEDAITTPIKKAECPISLAPPSVALIVKESGGYPYFIQFICREVYDVFIQQAERDELGTVPIDAIQRKLDSDFFAGRWARVTDRQRQLLYIAATLEKSDDDEFTIQDLSGHSHELLPKGFSPSHINQMLGGLADQGLIYKNRFGKYSFAVPLLGRFILRIYEPPGDVQS